MKHSILFIITLLTFNLSSAQIKVGNKAIMPYEQKFDEVNLKLNGAGLREVLWIDLYAGGLYLKEKEKNPLAILEADEQMAIKINVVSGFVTQKKMIKGVKAGFKKATFGNIKPLKKRIARFIKFFNEPIVRNDIFDLVYVKDVGIKAFKNDKELGVIEGRDFKYALFKIWLGEDPVSEDLKNGMLGVQK